MKLKLYELVGATLIDDESDTPSEYFYSLAAARRQRARHIRAARQEYAEFLEKRRQGDPYPLWFRWPVAGAWEIFRVATVDLPPQELFLRILNQWAWVQERVSVVPAFEAPKLPEE